MPRRDTLVARCAHALLYTVLFAGALTFPLGCSPSDSFDDAQTVGVDSDPAELTAEVLDSAGVVLRRSPARALERVAYSSDDAPRLLIDGTEGGGQPLHAVGAVVFGPGGTIAIAERGEMGVRIHGEDGRRVRVIGRDGQGPGEFGALNGLGFRQDSMFVFDSRWFRISVFDPAGEYVRQVVPESAWGDRPRWFAFAPALGIVTTSRGSGRQLVWGLHDFDGAPIRSFEDAPSPETPTLTMLGPSGAPEGPSEPLRLFTAQPIAGAWGDRVVVTSGADYRLQLLGTSGAVTEIWSVADAAPRRVTDADVEAARERVLANTDADLRAATERRWSNVDPAERFPAFGEGAGMIFSASPQIIESSSGELWVRAYPADPAPMRGPRWWVFRHDGTLMGSVDFPPRFELHAVGDAGALGILEDAYDVQRVAVFSLRAGG